MEIRIHEDRRLAEIWLTKAEQQDAALRESLKPVYQQYREQKYLVAVYLSGQKDLYEQTRNLLLYNRQRTAQRQVQSARRQGPAMER